MGKIDIEKKIKEEIARYSKGYEKEWKESRWRFGYIDGLNYALKLLKEEEK